MLLCQVRDINSWSRGNALAYKQTQLITMHRSDFSDKGRAIKGFFYVLLIVYCIPLQADNLMMKFVYRTWN